MVKLVTLVYTYYDVGKTKTATLVMRYLVDASEAIELSTRETISTGAKASLNRVSEVILKVLIYFQLLCEYF